MLVVFIPIQTANCMDLRYEFALSDDGGSRPHVTVSIQDIKLHTLEMVFNWPVVDGLGNLYPHLLNFVENVSVKNVYGDSLPITWSERILDDTNWYWGFVHPIYYKAVSVETLGYDEIILEYDISSNSEILSAVGVTEASWLSDIRAKDFWHGYLENILLRPFMHDSVSAATFEVILPYGWDFSTVYPKLAGNTVDLGRMDYMYGDNIRWKNYQRSAFVAYDTNDFVRKTKNVSGVQLIDVCPNDLDKERNQEAFYEYFEYLSNSIGEIPIYAYLTFNMYANSNIIQYHKVFRALPYGYEHGITGEFDSAAGGDIGAFGTSLSEVPLWSFNGWGPEDQPHLWYSNMVRPWIFLFIQFDPFAPWFKGGFWTYYENMTAAQRYGLNDVIERRLKPMYRYYVDNIAGPPEVDEKNSWGKTFRQYYKPCLTAYYIDQLLKEKSNGTKTINDLMQLLFQKAEQGIAIDREIFTGALNSLTSFDFTSVIEDYLYGSKKLLLDKYLLPSSVYSDIRANGSDGSLIVPPGTPISIQVSLDPYSREGESADWWIAANTPFIPLGDWYTYVYPNGWLPGINLCVQTGLFGLSSYEVLNMELPIGDYTFYFALDDPDGEATGPWWTIDSVKVTVE